VEKTPAWNAERKGGAVPSSFKTTELSVEKRDNAVWSRELFVEQTSQEKDQLEARLLQEEAYDLATVLQSCGSEMRLVCQECTAVRVVRVGCKKRWCPCCAPGLAAKRVKKYQAAVLAMKWPLHVTFTITNKHALEAADLVALLKAFRRLRQRRIWKCTVRGGFVSLEITNRGKGWHPHLHVVADCEWLSLTTSPPTKWMSKAQKKNIYAAAARELEQTWCELVGQKTASVKTRRKYGGAEGARSLAVETMKYTVEPSALIECKGSASEAIYAMNKVRLFRGFGSCYRLKLDDEVKEPSMCDCGECNSWRPETIVEARIAGPRMERAERARKKVMRSAAAIAKAATKCAREARDAK